MYNDNVVQFPTVHYHVPTYPVLDTMVFDGTTWVEEMIYPEYDHTDTIALHYTITH